MLGAFPPSHIKLIRNISITSLEEDLSMQVFTMNKRSHGEMSIGVSSNGSPTPLKSRKLNASFTTSSVSSHSSTHSSTFGFITLPKRPSSQPSLIPHLLSPCTFITVKLSNSKIKSRIDPFSIEQAMYFEPYEEGEIDIDLLKAIRSGDLGTLRSMMNDTENDHDLKARNRFGENLAHLACRVTGSSEEVLKFLVEDAEVQLNVRDKFGRTPLHNACMSSIPNFNNIYYVMQNAPKLFVFEDDKNKLPLDLIPHKCFDRWTRFMAEKNFLKNLCVGLLNDEGPEIND